MPGVATYVRVVDPHHALPALVPARDGQIVFVNKCLTCHTMNNAGSASAGPDLNLPMNPTEYFTAVEEIMRGYGGRPHWGKMHTRTAETLREAYPRFDDFLQVRDELDPDRRFANPYLERVLGA